MDWLVRIIAGVGAAWIVPDPAPATNPAHELRDPLRRRTLSAALTTTHRGISLRLSFCSRTVGAVPVTCRARGFISQLTSGSRNS